MLAHHDAAAAADAAAVSGDALQRAGHMLGPGIGESGVFETLRRDPQVQGSLLALVHVGGEFAHHLDELLLHVCRCLESTVGGAAHAYMHERGHHGVVAGETEPLEVIERGRDAGGGQARDLHERVGGYALVGVRVDERLHDGHERIPVAALQFVARESVLGVLD